MSPRAEMVGKRFHRLFVLTEIKAKPHPSGRITRRFLTICDCGTEKEISGVHLRAGKIQSCGCYKQEETGRRQTTHGDAPLRRKQASEYTTWGGMKRRCHNEGNQDYYLYGARGIKVCERWLNSYPNFLADMGRKPSAKHSLDRINSDGDYEPANCRWATAKQQYENQSRHSLKAANRILKAELKEIKQQSAQQAGWSQWL